MLTYLASVLALYDRRGEGVTSWGYRFDSTSSGAPFSSVLSMQIERLVADEALVIDGDGLQLTEHGRALQHGLARLQLTASRIGYLDSASSTLLALPPGVIRAAFGQGLSTSTLRLEAGARPLSSEASLAQLYADFDTLAAALGPGQHSLLAASVLWLSYLVEQTDPFTELDD